MKQRGKFALTTVILYTVAAHPIGITKTSLMQEAMLNYNRVNRYCLALLSLGLLTYDQSTRLFKITSKGKDALRLCEEAAAYIYPIDHMISKYTYKYNNCPSSTAHSDESIVYDEPLAHPVNLEYSRIVSANSD